jgi:hypothetical protein
MVQQEKQLMHYVQSYVRGQLEKINLILQNIFKLKITNQ